MATEGLAFVWKLCILGMLMTLNLGDICSSLTLDYISLPILSSFITLTLNDLRFTVNINFILSDFLTRYSLVSKLYFSGLNRNIKYLLQ